MRWYAWLFILVGCTSQPPVQSISAPPARTRDVEVACLWGATDEDEDGLSDDCELEFARTFAPMLVVQSEGCNWDTSVTPARLGGEYLYAIQALSGDHVRIAYLPAYYRDCGWDGIKCLLPFVDCSPHAGDSEAVMVDATRGSSGHPWHVAAVFLSAHCFGRGSDCRWYRGLALDEFEWTGAPAAAPVVWVAAGRQANYPSKSACDAGHSTIDTCDHNLTRYRFPIRGPLQNIGSRSHPRGGPGGCLTVADLQSESGVPAPMARECFWDDQVRFGGWQQKSLAGGSTPYAKYLAEVAGF